MLSATDAFETCPLLRCLSDAPGPFHVGHGGQIGKQHGHGLQRHPIAFLVQFSNGVFNDKGLVISLAGVPHRGLDTTVGGHAAHHKAIDVYAVEQRFQGCGVKRAGAIFCRQ